MSIFRRIAGLARMGRLYLAGTRVQPSDFAAEYDRVAPADVQAYLHSLLRDKPADELPLCRADSEAVFLAHRSDTYPGFFEKLQK